MSQIIARFTGINQIKYARGTRTHGPFPDSALIYFIPQDVTTLDGTLTFQLQETVEWHDARLDAVSQRRTTRGGIVNSAIVFDRRIWWQYAVVDGVCNERGDDGLVVPHTERSPQQIAAYLFSAGGEIGFDVSALPNGATDRPYCNWIGANPFYVLEKLCNERGCTIRLGLDNTASIVRLGQGDPLPVGGRRDISVSVDVAESPRVVRAYCGPTIVESKLRLEAISGDEDGAIRTVADLLDEWGWSIENAEDLFPEEATPARRRIAKRDFFRLWRIKDQAHQAGTFNPPGYAGTTLPNIDYLLPLFNGRTSSYDGPQSRLANSPRVEGIYIPNSEVVADGADANTEEGTPIDCDFSFYRNLGHIRTHRPLIKFNEDSDGFEAAELVLRVSYPITNPDTLQHLRYTRDKDRGIGRGIYPLRLDDLQRRITAIYGAPPSGALTVQDIADNKDLLDIQIDAAIAALETKFDTKLSAAAEYQGIRAINTSGSVRQVTWTVNPKQGAGATTRASLNVETDPYTMSERYRARLGRELRDSQDRPWRQRQRRRIPYDTEG